MRSKFIGMMLLMLFALPFGQGVLAQAVPDNIELIGIVDAIDNNSITINGQIVDISTAEIELAVFPGDTIKIEGTLDSSGQIIAREVGEPGDDPNPSEIEFIGLVDSIDSTSVAIGSMVIDLTGAEISGTIVVGVPLKVHATFADNGSLQAREAQVGLAPSGSSVPQPAATPEASGSPQVTGNNGAGEFEITGILDQVGNGFIVIDDQTISIIDAEIKDALVPGQLVKVHVSNQNSQLVAREVENALDDDDDDGGSSNSGPGNNDDDDDDGGSSNSGSGNNDDDDDDGGSNSGSGNNNDDDDDGGSNSGRGGGGDNDDDD